jgi:hypothetical protein
VKDSTGQKLAYVYYEGEPGRRSAAKLLTIRSKKGHERSQMAEPEVEAAWRAKFERSGAKEPRDVLDSDGFRNELKRQAAFRWLGGEAEVQRLQQEHTFYVRWTFFVVLGVVIAGLIAVGLALLR